MGSSVGALGAGDDYDAVRLEIKWFLEHGNGHVFAIREFNRLTYDAPIAAEASIQLRGYKLGQYLGKYMSSLEVEERLRFSRRWGATLFAGVGCLYGDGQSCSSRDNVYPTYGGGFRADLVVLRRSPLDDIRNTRAIDSVDQDGREAPPVSQTVDH